MPTIYISIVNFCIKMIMIGIKWELQEQLQYKSFIKCINIDVTASICNNFSSYLTVMSSVYITHLQLIIYKSYVSCIG